MAMPTPTVTPSLLDLADIKRDGVVDRTDLIFIEHWLQPTGWGNS